MIGNICIKLTFKYKDQDLTDEEESKIPSI